MAALRAAPDFGLDPAAVEAIALDCNPRRGDLDSLVDALASTLIDQGALDVPDAM
jgi:hypothetical protein